MEVESPGFDCLIGSAYDEGFIDGECMEEKVLRMRQDPETGEGLVFLLFFLATFSDPNQVLMNTAFTFLKAVLIRT